MSNLQARIETGAVIAAWFVLNIAIATVTKWTYLHGQICHDRLPGEQVCRKYKFPVAVTVIHMLFSWAFCALFLQLREMFAPSGKGAIVWPLRKQATKVAPLAVSFALSVAGGNLALKYVFPSFTQMLGGMTPAITVIIQVAVMGKRYNMWTWLSMPILCGGLAICSAGEMNFHILGCLYAVASTILRSLKSILQGQLLVDPADKVDSITLLYFMAPWAGIFLMFTSVVLEEGEPFMIFFPRNELGFRAEPEGFTKLLALLALGGLNACLLNIANFMVTSYTNAVTLQVLGNVKNCMSIGFSIMVLGNAFTPMQGLGLAVCLFGVYLYNSRGGTVKQATTSAQQEGKQQVPASVEEGKGGSMPPSSATSAELAQRSPKGAPRLLETENVELEALKGTVR